MIAVSWRFRHTERHTPRPHRRLNTGHGPRSRTERFITDIIAIASTLVRRHCGHAHIAWLTTPQSDMGALLCRPKNLETPLESPMITFPPLEPVRELLLFYSGSCCHSVVGCNLIGQPADKQHTRKSRWSLPVRSPRGSLSSPTPPEPIRHDSTGEVRSKISAMGGWNESGKPSTYLSVT